jgi:CRP-like cAMP-binding protein
MRHQEIHADETLFFANDPASELFYIVEGTLFLPELQQEIGPGRFLGDFALFSESGRRTATAIPRTDCLLMSLGQ